MDRDDREREILDVALDLLSRGGYGSITVRAIADELGGSPTLVTYYFSTQAVLMTAMLERQLDLFNEELAQLEVGSHDRQRLEILVDWFLPDDPESWAQERARVHLASELGTQNEWVRPYLDRLDDRMTQLLRDHLAPLVASEDLATATDALRMALSGIVLSAVEHPADWPATRQRQVAELILSALPIRGDSRAART